MDSYPNTSNAQPSVGNPAFSAGLEAGLVGAVLILIEQLLQNFINLGNFGWVLGFLRVCIWVGVGALAVYWLKGKGSILRSDQSKAGIIAGFLTGLVTGLLLVIFGYVKNKSVEDIPLPPDLPIDTFNQVYGATLGVTLVCCYGLPSLIIATAFSFGGGMLISLFVGGESRGPAEQPYTSQVTYQPEIAPEPEPPPTRLEDFLSVERLPLELHTSVAAFKRGELDIARPAFVRFLRENPKHADVWLWMSVMIPDVDRQEECIRRALAIEPHNETARKMLAFLQRSSNLYG